MKYKGRELTKVMRLLALTSVTAPGMSVGQWRPFEGGEKLDKIVDEHNVKCLECYERYWLPEQIAALVDAVIEIEQHDLSSVDELQVERYKNIRILLVDLRNAEKVMDVAPNITYRAGRYGEEHSLYLLQIAGTSSVQSLEEQFRPVPTIPRPSPIFTDEESF
jgi:hypothetical protein